MKLSILTVTLITTLALSSCKNKTASAKDANKEKGTPSFELLWETDTIFKTPESCLFDAKHNVIYVSNINDAPRTKDNNGYISLLHTDGSPIKLDWATGMSAPKGMGYYDEILYVTDIDTVLEIDAHTGKTIRKHTLEGALMLNDLTIDAYGTVYVSAMDTNKIYTLNDGDFTLWKDNMNKPNGLLAEGDYLFVASLGAGTFKAYDIKTKEEKKHIASNLGKADGVVRLNSGNYVVSDWLGEIFHVDRSGETTSLLNTKENKKSQTADIGSIPNKKIILVPTFFGNSVKAFKLNE